MRVWKILIVGMFLIGCGGGGGSSSTVDNIVEAGESVIVTPGDSVKVLSDDTQLQISTDPITKESNVTVLQGSIEVVRS